MQKKIFLKFNFAKSNFYIASNSYFSLKKIILKTPILQFCELLEESLTNYTFRKLTLSKPLSNASNKDLKNVYIRQVQLKGTLQLQLTFRYATRDEFKNYLIEDAIAIILLLLETDFLNADLFTATQEISLMNGKKILKKTNQQFKTDNDAPPSVGAVPSALVSEELLHDRPKQRLIEPEAAYLFDLDITTSDGKVSAAGQKKYKQINKYIEIIDSLLKEKPLPDAPKIVDMGSGKGYLTFALYDFLTNQCDLTPEVFGIELRKQLVDFCNKLAIKNQFTKLVFEAKDIIEFEEKIDMLIALHACDTATDIAIAKGIKANAAIIVVAPCCHKQIRRQLEASVSGVFQPILKHGIFCERTAEMITDTIRALLLEVHGYKTKVFEFISTEHTAKNVMIVATLQQKNLVQSQKILLQIDNLKQQFGIQSHFLEQLLAE